MRGTEPSLTASLAEDLLRSFLQDCWLYRSAANGKILVGPKAVLELQSYLLEEQLFAACGFCKSLIVSGRTSSCSAGETGEDGENGENAGCGESGENGRSKACSAVLHECCAKKASECPGCRRKMAQAGQQ